MPVPSLPAAPRYVPPPQTQEKLNWAELPIVDLSKAQSPEGLAELVPLVRDAMHTRGFMYVVNHGLSQAENDRMFDIANVPLTQVPQEERMHYLTKAREVGYFRGYKMPKYFHIDNGVRDQIENYSVHFFPDMQEHPNALHPFISEIAEFCRYSHCKILYPILRILARGLELPEDTFLKMHTFDGDASKSFLRFQKYHPYSAEDSKQANDVWLKGHVDYTSISILWSQPISALQIKSPDGEWRWVRHVENALVVNIGDAMEMLSGGYYKAAIHRVVQPPADQRNIARLNVFYFVSADDSVKLAPLADSPVLKRVGIADKHPGVEAPTMMEWRIARTKAYGVAQLEKGEDGTEREEILRGVFTTHYS